MQGDKDAAAAALADLQARVAQLECRDGEVIHAAETIKARVTLVEGAVRLLQGMSVTGNEIGLHCRVMTEGDSLLVCTFFFAPHQPRQ